MKWLGMALLTQRVEMPAKETVLATEGSPNSNSTVKLKANIHLKFRATHSHTHFYNGSALS